MKTIILKCFYKNMITLKTEIFCSNSDKEYYDKECINLLLKNLKR